MYLFSFFVFVMMIAIGLSRFVQKRSAGANAQIMSPAHRHAKLKAYVLHRTGFIHVMENLENLEKYFCHGMSWKSHGILFFWKSHGNVMEFCKHVMEKVPFYEFHN